MISSLDAHRFLQGRMELSSWEQGWRSLLLREYVDPPNVDTFTTAATPEYFISMVTAGSCRLESWREGAWHRASLRVGALGFRRPGSDSTLRWVSDTPHRTLQLYIPTAVFDEVREGLGSSLHIRGFHTDPLIESVLLALKQGVQLGAPDLYADSAAHFLAAHLLQRYSDMGSRRAFLHDDARLGRADDYLRSRISEPVTLEAIARAAGVSRFHLLRLFKAAYGETPLKRLTRLRMAEATRLLAQSNASITEIALLCGYGDSAHFAAAFRRQLGLAPGAYRAALGRREPSVN